jgi:hypothetical protein
VFAAPPMRRVVGEPWKATEETMRVRSLIAISAIVGGLFLYALAVMLLAELLPPYWPVQTGFFAVAGLVWILPAAGFVRWGVGRRPPAG